MVALDRESKPSIKSKGAGFARCAVGSIWADNRRPLGSTVPRHRIVTITRATRPAVSQAAGPSQGEAWSLFSSPVSRSAAPKSRPFLIVRQQGGATIRGRLVAARGLVVAGGMVADRRLSRFERKAVGGA